MSTILTLHDPETARAHYLTGVWQSETMYGLLAAHAAERGGRYALRDPTRRLTWAALKAWVDAVALALEQAGLNPGDRVAVWLPNRVEATVVFLACSRAGYVCNPSLHQNYTVDEIITLLDRVEARALFAQPGYGADASRTDVFARAAELQSMRRVFAMRQPGNGEVLPRGAHAFPSSQAAASPRAPQKNADKVVYLAFTSGTTGAPKGVMHSDNTLLANGRAMVADWSHDESTVLLSLSPMSHHIGTVALEQALVAGCELVMHDALSGKAPLDWILECGASYVMGVPTHAMDILVALRQLGQNTLGRVKVFYMAGAPIPRETAERFLQLGIKPQNVYGMTENGSHQYTLPGDSADTITATCGRACRGYEIRLWSQDNPDIETVPGDVGEIGGRGGLLMLGYYSNQSATEKSFNAQGWFMSGDLGLLDPQGNVKIVGRKKDLIIRGGHNIHPARIEDLAHRHASVRKAAAFPVADERLGEKVCLAVIAQGEAPAPESMLAHLDAAGLSKFDMPEYYIVMPEFPLTPSGKILKRELIEWVKAGRISPLPVRFKSKEAKA
jgi:acyl-CoA synthetase